MDGLEAVEIKFTKFIIENPTKRFDSEYFKKQYLLEDKNRTHYQNKLIGDIAFVTDGQHGYHEVDENSNIHLLTAKNAKGFFADLIEADKVAKWLDENNKRSSLKEKDIILSTRGTVGFCALVKEEILPAQIDQDVARIFIQDKNFIPEFIVTYLNCIYGQDWMKRNQTGMVQQGLPLQRVRQLPIPYLSLKFQNKIKQLVDNIYSFKKQTEYLYSQAETSLLKELNLHNWQPSQANTEVKTFKNSFLQSGRLDAEYYQPKYDVLTEKIQQAEHYKLSELVKIKKSIEPGSAAYLDNGIPFIRVANLSKFGLSEPDIHLSVTHQKDIEDLFPKRDTILLSKDGSVGIAYKVEENLKVITSGAILHLTVKNEKLIPDYLTLVLNSVLTQLQAERDAGGSIIQHWRISEIENVLIPVMEIDKQQQIAQLIQQSFSLKKQSQQLLQTAKQAVEMAIEEGEEKSIEWINSKKAIL